MSNSCLAVFNRSHPSGLADRIGSQPRSQAPKDPHDQPPPYEVATFTGHNWRLCRGHGHSCDSFPWVGPTHQPGQPRPFAPQPTAIRRWITATTGGSAGVPASVLSPSRIPPLGVLPLTPDHPEWYRGPPSHVPHETQGAADSPCTPRP